MKTITLHYVNGKFSTFDFTEERFAHFASWLEGTPVEGSDCPGLLDVRVGESLYLIPRSTVLFIEVGTTTIPAVEAAN